MEIVLEILVQFVLPVVTAFVGYLAAVSKSKADDKRDFDKAKRERMKAIEEQEDRLREEFTNYLKDELREYKLRNEQLTKQLKAKNKKEGG